MKRRDFITLLGGAAVAWPLSARAQQSAMPVIGFLNSGSPDPQGDRVRGFRQGLSEAGYDEGRNVTIEYRWAEGRNDRLPELAAELVRRRVSLLAPVGIPASLAAKQATTTVPIVFSIAADPVEAGLVPSLSRPSGNLTGVTSLNVELAPKKLEMLHALLPGAKSIALMVNPTNPIVADTQSRELRVAAASLALQLHVVEAGTEQDFERAGHGAGRAEQPPRLATLRRWLAQCEWRKTWSINCSIPARSDWRVLCSCWRTSARTESISR